MIPTIFICILLSFFVGFFGRNRRMGFWGYFFASIVLTPLIGMLLVIISGSNEPSEKEASIIVKNQREEDAKI